MYLKTFSKYKLQIVAKFRSELSKNTTAIISYYTLRKWIGILGMALPIVLVIGGFLRNNYSVEGSISSYYYTNMGDYFVGLLCAVGLFLITYKGYKIIDDIVTVLSGIFALGIIAFPTSLNYGRIVKVGIFMINDNISEYVHLTFAALFFLLLSFNSYFLFTKHGKKITEIKLIKNKIYKACGIIMLLSIVCIAVYIWLLKDTFITQLKPVLVFESIALCAFGISWLVKGQR